MSDFLAGLPSWQLALLLVLLGVPLLLGWVYAIRCITRWVRLLPCWVRASTRRALLRLRGITDRALNLLSDGDNVPRR
jgi:hypothetical protein